MIGRTLWTRDPLDLEIQENQLADLPFAQLGRETVLFLTDWQCPPALKPSTQAPLRLQIGRCVDAPQMLPVPVAHVPPQSTSPGFRRLGNPRSHPAMRRGIRFGDVWIVTTPQRHDLEFFFFFKKKRQETKDFHLEVLLPETEIDLPDGGGLTCLLDIASCTCYQYMEVRVKSTRVGRTYQLPRDRRSTHRRSSSCYPRDRLGTSDPEFHPSSQ